MVKQYFKWILPVVAMPMLMASCTNDEPHPELNQYVTINRVGVGSLTTRTGYEASDNFLPETGTMKLILNSSNSEAKYSTTGLNFTPSAEGWTPATPLPWAVNSTADWSVFFTSRSASEYSFNAETRELTWSVPADQSVLTEAQFNGLDLLYAGGSTSSANISPSLKHAMAKIRFNLNDKTGSLKGKTITKVIYLASSGRFYTSITNNVVLGSDWSWSELKNNSDASCPSEIILYQSEAEQGSKSTYEAILIPQVITGSMRIKIFIDGESEPTYYSSISYSQGFKSGYLYEYDLLLEGDYVELNGATIKAWDEVSYPEVLETEE